MSSSAQGAPDRLRAPRIAAERLLKDLRSNDPDRARAAAARCVGLSFIRPATVEGVLAAKDTVRRKHALDVVARESGAQNWRDLVNRSALAPDAEVAGPAPATAPGPDGSTRDLLWTLPVAATIRQGDWTIRMVSGDGYLADGLELHGRGAFVNGSTVERVVIMRAHRDSALLLRIDLFPGGSAFVGGWTPAAVEVDPAAHEIRIGVIDPQFLPGGVYPTPALFMRQARQARDLAEPPTSAPADPAPVRGGTPIPDPGLVTPNRVAELARTWDIDTTGFIHRRGYEPRPVDPEAMADEVQAAVDWLVAHGRTTKLIGGRAPTSYTLKHVMERHTGRYVSNGAFLLAALHCGLQVKQAAESPNGFLNIARATVTIA